MSEKIQIPMSEALACVHYQIEMNDIDAAKAMLRILIRQVYEVERGIPIPEIETNDGLEAGLDLAEEKSDDGC